MKILELKVRNPTMMSRHGTPCHDMDWSLGMHTRKCRDINSLDVMISKPTLVITLCHVVTSTPFMSRHRRPTLIITYCDVATSKPPLY